jgi:DNA-binding beta-propeller fold protein YncE
MWCVYGEDASLASELRAMLEPASIMKRKLILPVMLALGASALTQTTAPAAPSKQAALPLSLVADLPLPGNPSRFDYQWIDTVNRRLYIAHLGDSSLVVFDLDDQRVSHEVAHLPSIHGVVAAPALHLVFATATAEKTLALIDDQTFEVKSRVPAGEYPNGLAFDSASEKVFVSNNNGKGVAVVDVKTAKALPGIEIGGGAGNTQWDADSGHILAAVHGSAYLADIDPAKDEVPARIALDHVSTCHGLLVASTLRLAFAACRGSAPVLAVVDLNTRRQIQLVSLPPEVDVLAFDPGLQRLYAASETGMVAVFSVAADHTVTELGRGLLASNAHTVAVDPATHRVYFPLQNVSGHPVLRVMDARIATGSAN